MIDRNHLVELTARYADGVATDDEVRALESALRDDADFRRTFLRYMNLDAALGGVSGAAPAGEAGQRGPGRRDSRRSPWRWVRAWGGVAAAAGLLLAVWMAWPDRASRKQASPPVSQQTPVTDPAVVLTAATAARWADPDVELSLRGGEMPAGTLRLESGVAEFRFARGATAVLLGPAAVRFPGANQVFLGEGKVLCRCPTPESRLTLTTPATQVVDLGTEFAVDASAEAGTRVAVVSGQVRVGGGQVLGKGQSAVVGADQVVRIAPLPPDAFAGLFRADPSRVLPPPGSGNLLADQTLEGVAPATPAGPWQGTDGYVEVSAGGGSVAVHARGHRLWPGVRQTVATGDISGRLVLATVEGTSPANDPLCERESAILKIAFLDAAGREFASASRHFLQAGEKTPLRPGTLAGEVAAFAPAGTRKIQYQLLLSARGQPAGTVWFSHPALTVGGPPNPPATRP